MRGMMIREIPSDRVTVGPEETTVRLTLAAGGPAGAAPGREDIKDQDGGECGQDRVSTRAGGGGADAVAAGHRGVRSGWMDTERARTVFANQKLEMSPGSF